MVENKLFDLFILKYYCDNNQLKYEDIIKENTLKELEIPNSNGVKTYNVEYVKLISLIEYEDLKELIIEYINKRNIGINYLNNQEKKLCLTSDITSQIYDLDGNTTYIIDKFCFNNYNLPIYKFFDKVLKLNNKYLKYDEINIHDFNYLYVFDFTPKYRFIRFSESDPYEFIRGNLYKNDKLKVILHTSFKKISNMSDARFILPFLKKIVFYDDDNTFLYFNKEDNDKVSIIKYNKDKIKSLDKLYEIIESDKKIKDVLIKIKQSDIRSNYYRIGFKLYQEGSIENTKNINEIVDENTRLIGNLSDINKVIEEEVNKLINK